MHGVHEARGLDVSETLRMKVMLHPQGEANSVLILITYRLPAVGKVK